MKSVFFVLFASLLSFSATADECMNFVDLDQEDPGVKESIYKELALSQIPSYAYEGLVYKTFGVGRMGALVSVGSGNDYIDLYYVVLDLPSRDIFMAYKFGPAATRAQLVAVNGNGAGDAVTLNVKEKASVENPVEKNYSLTMYLNGTTFDAETCTAN